MEDMKLTEAELKTKGYKELGRLMGTGLYTGESWRLLAYYYNEAKGNNKY